MSLVLRLRVIHTADLRAATNAGKADPLFANVLVTGFTGVHWPLWHLLRARGVSAAKQATVLLDDPRDETRELDEAWSRHLRKRPFGEAEPISPAVNYGGDSLFTERRCKRCDSFLGENSLIPCWRRHNAASGSHRINVHTISC